MFATLGVACTGTMEERFPLVAAGPDAGAPVAAACDDPVDTTDDGYHNPGQACLACHNGAGAPAFTIGGTLYADLAGATPVVGATVHVVDAEGTDVAMVTGANGNFYTTAALAFPVTTYASSCPDERDMISQVDASGGDCNKGGCHAEGFRATLP